jgi:peptidoglycan/xylan/chitin deacetylase (PgdA/CDA1 family)
MSLANPRYRYSAITQRDDYSWPDGKRLAVYLALNVEQYRFGEGIIEELVPAGPQPDVLNYSWCEYGTRVGVWRLLKMLDDFQLPVTLLVNTDLYEAAPIIMDAFRNRSDEIACHGRTNSERQAGMPQAEECALIEEATRIIQQHEGQPPKGWLSPWISETQATPDLLKAAGYHYVLDWCSDDQPIWLRTNAGPLLAVPYPQELNDSSTMIGRFTSAAEFADMVTDTLEEMLRQSQEQPLVMGIALHAHISGQPFRLKHLRRVFEMLDRRRNEFWLTRAGSIADHVERLLPIPE